METLTDRHSGRLTRRAFVQGAGAGGLGLLAGCGRLPWQPPAASRQPYRVAVLELGTIEQVTPVLEAFREGLHQLGYEEDHYLILDSRVAAQEVELPALAEALVAARPDVIVAAGTRAAPLQQAGAMSPIVNPLLSDPVGSGTVASFAQPGGNITGLSVMTAELAAKRLELLKTTVPRASRMAILWNPNATNPSLPHQVQETEAAAQVLGLRLQWLAVRAPAEIDEAFDLALRDHVDALAIVGDPLTSGQRTRIAERAVHIRLPTIAPSKVFPVAGTLMSYGPDMLALYRRAAYYVDRILKGAKPADLPVEQPMTFEFVVNLKTAQTLGITFPDEIMLQVTEVIQ